MKIIKIIVSLLFVILTVASAAVFIGEKVNTDKTIPQIKIEEDIIEVSLKATDEELLKGVTAYDEKDKDLTDRIIVESISKFTEKGVCKVTYAVCDSDNNVSKAIRKIRYKGYESPKFKVTGNLCFSLYEKIDLTDKIEVWDSLEGNISKSMVITSEKYSVSDAGAYSIDATVTNKKGDTATVNLPLIIEDRPISVPVIELTEYLIYIQKGETVDFQSYIVDALENEDRSLKNKVIFESTIDFNKPGTYQVHYYVTGSNDLRGHSVLTVIVGE